MFCLQVDPLDLYLSPLTFLSTASRPMTLRQVQSKDFIIRSYDIPTGTCTLILLQIIYYTLFILQFGGNDLLQIYNAQQIKHRLNTIGMYVASTKVCFYINWLGGECSLKGQLFSVLFFGKLVYFKLLCIKQTCELFSDCSLLDSLWRSQIPTRPMSCWDVECWWELKAQKEPPPIQRSLEEPHR